MGGLYIHLAKIELFGMDRIFEKDQYLFLEIKFNSRCSIVFSAASPNFGIGVLYVISYINDERTSQLKKGNQGIHDLGNLEIQIPIHENIYSQAHSKCKNLKGL
jgi:hypothetical protein